MLQKPHESVLYQEFLISDYREHSVPANAYLKPLLDDDREKINFLDFGSGLGYVSALLGNHYRKKPKVHIYAAEYQEDLIDLFWKRLVTQKLENITPFFLPDRSFIYFPKWIPAIDHCYFSFSLSTVDDPFKVFETIKSKLSETAILHILDWEPEAKNHRLVDLFPAKDRLTPNILLQWLELTGFKVLETQIAPDKDYFYIQAQIFEP